MKKAVRKPSERRKSADTKRFGRSRLANGAILPDGIDGRSSAARRFRDLYREYMALTDGLAPDLCRQLASLVITREGLDAQAARGELVDPLGLSRICGAIGRTRRSLGLDTAQEHRARLAREAREDAEAGLL